MTSVSSDPEYANTLMAASGSLERGGAEDTAAAPLAETVARSPSATAEPVKLGVAPLAVTLAADSAAAVVRLQGTPRGVTGADADGALEPGARVGRYVILSRLGAGGMGVVYGAHDPELDRRVALKLLRATPTRDQTGATQAAQVRLLREAQAMARLSHPNVVAVHDVGTYSGGVFLAMEFVDGGTLRAWLDARKRSWVEVTAKFVDAARGLAAAHAAGLIHRDFKPDNVMVGVDERVRVMDLGLARAHYDAGALDSARGAASMSLSASSTLETPLTIAGALLGTPGYMAPEQLGLVDEPVDERADQFAFCVALWEGLTGSRLFTGRSLSALLASMARPRSFPASTSAPRWLRHAVLRGLALHPRDRWPSMTALVDHIEREPRRRRASRLGLVGGLVAVGVAAGGWQFARVTDRACDGVEEALAGVWDDARREQVSSAFAALERAYTEDMTRRAEAELDAYADAWVEQARDNCEATRIRELQSAELMDARARCLDQRRQELGALVEVFRAADEEVVTRAVQATAALPDVGRCGDLEYVTAATPPPDDPALAAAVDRLSSVIAELRALEVAGKYKVGLERLDEVFGEIEQLGYEPLLARAVHRRGKLELADGMIETAAVTLADAYHEADALGLDELAGDAALSLMMVWGVRLNKYEQADRWTRHARAKIRRVQDPEAAASLEGVLCLVDRSRSRLDDALTHCQDALDRSRALFGASHVRVAGALADLGSVYIYRGAYDEAMPWLEQAIDQQVALTGSWHPRVAIVENMIAMALSSAMKDEEAVAHFERARDIWATALGPEHPFVGDANSNLGVVYTALGRFEDARAAFQRALAIAERVEGDGANKSATILEGMSALENAAGNHGVALDLATRALAAAERAFGDESVQVASASEKIVGVLFAQERAAEAVPHARRSLAVCGERLPSEHPYCVEFRENLIFALLKADELDEALPLAESHLEGLARVDPSPVVRAEAEFLVARALRLAGRDAERAESLARAALERVTDEPELLEELADEIKRWLRAQN